MNWYIGQEIVAIKNQEQGIFKEGELFTIRGLREAECKCKIVAINIGKFVDYKHHLLCKTCGYKSEIREHGVIFFDEMNFKPLDTLCDISELTEILETTKPFDV